MTSLNRKITRLVVVEGRDGWDYSERINCSTALCMEHMSQTQQTWSTWGQLRLVEMWGKGACLGRDNEKVD